QGPKSDGTSCLTECSLMTNIRLALVARTNRLSKGEVTRVAAALNKQLKNDFGPAWQINATIEAFDASKDVPPDYWPVTVRDRIEPAGAWTIHSEKDGRPFAEVTYGENWTVGASHDMMEMLTDPHCNRVIAGPSIRDDEKHDVSYFVQICDPCAGL